MYPQDILPRCAGSPFLTTMKLTDFQQQIIKKICAEQIFDIYSFVGNGSVSLHGGDKSKAIFSIRDDYIIRTNDPINTVPEQHEQEVYKQFKEFIALWDFLERIDLIKTIAVQQEGVRRLNIFRENLKPHYKIISLIYPYFNKEIAILPPLKDFVERGFLTEAEHYHLEEIKKWEDERHQRQVQFAEETKKWEYERHEREIQLEEERRSRKTSQRWTIAIGMSGILVGLFTVLFQYFTYKTDRNVTITNPSAFAETSKVMLVNPKPAEGSDSVMQKSHAKQYGKAKTH